MRTTCLINNFNYSQFVIEAIDSALNQTVHFDEIIVVDDCSTDESAQVLQERFLSHDRVKLILKQQNQGQLAAFNDGYAAATGDIIFFLDADDLFKETYLAEVLAFYQKHPECDFLFCASERFGNMQGVYLPDQGKFVSDLAAVNNFDRDLGYSVVLTLHHNLNHKKLFGSPTSTNSVRRRILDRMMPLPFPEDWRVGADGCLIYAASMVGARKFYLSQPLVKYRLHGNNNYEGNQKTFSTANFYHRSVRMVRLIEFFKQKMRLDETALTHLAHHEFRTIQYPRANELASYINLVVQTHTILPRKMQRIISMAEYFLMQNHIKKSLQRKTMIPHANRVIADSQQVTANS
jgi:glycosyltransferase involved in cell wall biosynthesis